MNLLATFAVAYFSVRQRSATGGRFIATEREACIRRSIRAVLMAHWLAGVGTASAAVKLIACCEIAERDELIGSEARLSPTVA